jgi:hypothetical protein
MKSDSKKLHDAYLKKRKDYLHLWSDEDNEYVKEKLLHCVITTELCMITYAELGVAAPRVPNILSKEYKSQSAQSDEMIKLVRAANERIAL